MDSQHEDRCNCKSDNSRLPTPQFPLVDPASQDPSSSSPAPFPATPTGRVEVPELTREVFNQDLIMVSYFSGTQHLSHGLLNWMKLYVRLQSWNLGNEDALTPDDLAIFENPSLIPILPTLRKKPRAERDRLVSQPGSMKQPLQRYNDRSAEASTTPLLLSDCKNPPAKLQCVPKTVATICTTNIAATTTKTSFPALIPTSSSLVPLKQMALCLIMSLANAENSAQKAAGTEPEQESETAFTVEHKPELTTKHASVSVWQQDLEHAPFNEKWKPTNENIDKDVDMSIHRLRAIKPITAEPDSIAETKHEHSDKPVPITESAHVLKVTPVTVSESMKKIEIAPIKNNSNLPIKEDTTLSITEVLFKLHAEKPNSIEPVLSTKTIPESTTTTECASVLQNAKKTKLASIDKKWKPSKKEMNEVDEISVSEFINSLQAFKPVTAKPATNDTTKPEPSAECASVSENALKIETAFINTVCKLLKKKVKKAIKMDKAPKQRHSDSVRRHHAECSNMENKKTASEYLYRLIAQMSATESETKPEPTTECAYVSENTLQLDPTPIDRKQKHWNEEDINETDQISTSKLTNRLIAQISAPKTKTTPEFTSEGAPVSDNAFKIEPAPIDKEGKLSKEEMSNVINTQNGEASPSAEKRRPRISARRRKKDKILESEFMYRLNAHIMPKVDTQPTANNNAILQYTQILQTTPLYENTNLLKAKPISDIAVMSIPGSCNGIHAKMPAATETKLEPEIERAPVVESMPIPEPSSVKSKRSKKRKRSKKDRSTPEIRAVPSSSPHMFATKAETKPEPTTECAYVSKKKLQLNPTPIDTKLKHWNEEEINKIHKLSTSKFINRLSAQTSATEKPATKTKTTPEYATKRASVSDSALKVEPASIDTEGQLSKEELNINVINTQNGEASPSAAKRRRKKDKISELEFINTFIAHMSATKAETKPETTTECAYVSENKLQLDPTPIDTKQKHWNEEEINKTEKLSTSKFITRLNAQTSAIEKPATKTKTTPEFTTEGASVSDGGLKIELAQMDTEGMLSKEEMNNVINTQNGEASPSTAKRRPHVSARRRKKDKISESEFINRLIAHMSATKPDTNPEPASKCACVSENTLHLDPTPIDIKQKHWNKEEINKIHKISASDFIYRLSAQTSATEKPPTKTKTIPEFTTEGAPGSERALKIGPAPIYTEEQLSKEEMNIVINTQNGEESPSSAKRRRKEDEILESEFIYRLIAHMSATKPEINPEPATKCACVSENTLHLDPTPIDTKQKHWNEEEINKIHKISASEFIYRVSAEASATKKPATKTKTTPEFITEGAPGFDSALRIEPAPMDIEGYLWKEEMNKVINTQNVEAPPSSVKRWPRISARRRKKNKIKETAFMYRLNAHFMPKAITQPEPTAKNTQILQATPLYENTNLLKAEPISDTAVMSMPGSCNGIHANMPVVTETKLKPEIERAPVVESMPIPEPSWVKSKRSKKRKRSNKDMSTPEIRAAPSSPSPASPSPASPSPACETYSTHFQKVRVTYNDFFNFLQHEFDKITQTDNDC